MRNLREAGIGSTRVIERNAGLIVLEPQRTETYHGFDLSQFANGHREEYLLQYLMRLGLVAPDMSAFIHKEPLRHRGSEAKYHVDCYTYAADGRRKDRILLSVVPPNSKSTIHSHPNPMVERYVPLAGQLFLNGDPIPPSGLFVAPHTVHQASARDVEAITLIIMHNAGRIPEHLQHILTNEENIIRLPFRRVSDNHFLLKAA